MKDKYKLALMDMAERFSLTSTAERLKVGCIIFKNDSIISLGVNGQPPKWSTEVCEDENYDTLSTVRHAEDAALQKLWLSTETSEGATVFVTHSPCLGCAIKLVNAKISKVYYRYEYRSYDGVNHLIKSGVEVGGLNSEVVD